MAISRAAGDHDRARLDALAAIRFEDEHLHVTRAVERLDRDRDHDVGAELLRLDKGAGGERLAAYPGRKAKVIFDPGAGPSLAAESAAVENRDRQAFGGAVNRGREPRRPGATTATS